MKKLIQSIGQRLDTLLDIFDVTPEEFMNYADIDEDEFNDIILDYSMPRISVIKDISSFFKLDEEFVVLGSGKISPKLKDAIKEHMIEFNYFGKIDECIKFCKKKLKQDGLPVNSDTIPKFDKENIKFVSYGAFNKENFPILPFNVDDDLVELFFFDYDDPDLITYDLQKLLDLDLIKDLKNLECIDLSTLHNCDDLNIIREIMDMMEETLDEDELIDQYNYLLEELNPKLENFWKIIVLLIDNGAYYLKDTLDDLPEKDESKTNIVYRIAKEHIKK